MTSSSRVAVLGLVLASLVGTGDGAPPSRARALASVGVRPLPWPRVPSVVCRAEEPSPARAPAAEYYDFTLVPTGTVPGLGRVDGTGKMTFQASPFGVAIAADGSYLYDVTLSFPNLRPPGQGALTVWFTTPSLDRIERKGVLTGGSFQAPVAFNKFLVVVTLEPEVDPAATAWSGPVVTRGMSRSGLMHTMAGHGPYETENCAAFGYGG